MKITPQWIEEKLATLPNEIAVAVEKYETHKEVWLNAQADYDREFAKQYLIAKAQGNTDMQSKMIATEKLYNKKLYLIKLEIECRKLYNKVEELSNKFTAIRKIANLKEIEIKNLGG